MSIYKSVLSIIWNANSLQVSLGCDGCSSLKRVGSQIFNHLPNAPFVKAVAKKNECDSPAKLAQFSNDFRFFIPKDLDSLMLEIKTNGCRIATANQTITENIQTIVVAFLVVKKVSQFCLTYLQVATSKIKMYINGNASSNMAMLEERLAMNVSNMLFII